ncbi:MAG: hypothetical protein MZU95_06480 [Desulfomicrobium escambiense]|nr:hypothetical protein [Desulfomicrobium escambiense]
MSTDADFVITMDYATVDNTAFAGSDYAAIGGNLAFAVGDTSATISVPIINPVDRGAHRDLLRRLEQPGARRRTCRIHQVSGNRHHH